MLRIFVFLCLVLLPSFAFGATYTVCNAGCDWTTIQGAFDDGSINGGNGLEPGDVVEVRADIPGGSKTYFETVTPGSNDSGATENHVIIRGRSGDTITIDGQGTRQYCFDISYSYITVDNFTMDHATTYTFRFDGSNGGTIQNCNVNCSTYGHQGIYFKDTTDVLIANNTITTDDGSWTGTPDGIYIQHVTTGIIEGNSIILRNDNSSPHKDCIQLATNSGASGGCKDIIIRNNYLEHNNASTSNSQGIYVSAANRGGYVYIYNNVYYVPNGVSTGSGGIIIDNGEWEGGTPATGYIYNNTVVVEGNVAHAYRVNEASYFQNNIAVMTNDNICFWIDEDNDGWTVANFHHNLAYRPTESGAWRYVSSNKTLATWQAVGGSPGTGSLFTDPSLDASHKPDAVGDPIVNAGIAINGTFTTDKDGTTRGDTWDIGAYEFSGSSDTTPPVISNIVPLPTVEYPSATTTVTVTWDTNECAVCRIGEVDEADEDDLTNLATVETQGACGAGYGTSFSYEFTSLSPEDAKTAYIGGQDEAADNETTDNMVSAFTIAASPPPGDRMTIAFP